VRLPLFDRRDTVPKPKVRLLDGTPVRSRSRVLLVRLALAALVFAAVASAAFAVRRPLLVGAAEFLRVEDARQPGDAIFLFAGNAPSRAFLAAELYHAGLAPRIVILRVADSPAVRIGADVNETDRNVAVLRRLEVPDSAIVVLVPPRGAASTRDEGRAFGDYAARHGLQRVLLVTDAFHSRRVRWVLRRELREPAPQLIVIPSEDWEFDAKNWWRSERGMIIYLQEYIKFVYYVFQG
jgi:uncharacterized SAM-binding protein YcdF (DUF218 family)